MALMTRELKASFAFVERNFNLTKRYWGWEVAFLVYAVAGALAVSLIGAGTGRRAPAADAGDRRRLLELPLGRLQLHRRDGELGALGGDAGVHLHGAGAALCPDARLDRLRHRLRLRPHRGGAGGAGALLRAGPLARQLRHRGGLHGARILLLHRDRDHDRHPAADVRGARRADDLRAAVGAAADQRRLLQHHRAARLDAVPLELQPGDLRARRGAGGADRRGRRDGRSSATSGRCC